MSWFDSTLSFLSPGWVGSIIGLLGLISVPIVYFLTRQRTSLSYAYLGEHLLGSASDALPSGISVHYHGTNIPRLTKSVIVLWNTGENTISGDDLVGLDPLRFHVGYDGAILSVMILKSTRVVNGFWVQTPTMEAPNESVMGFGFLGSGDGVVVEILHTSAKRHAEIRGTLRGLPKGLKSVGRITRSRSLKRNRPTRFFRMILSSISTWVPLVGGGAMMLIGLLANPETVSTVLTPSLEKTNTPVIIMGGV
ncbi:hypothetical protein EDF85_2423 [Pseudomonas putida]|uniref:Uncharacterized protein n=1 Tax=Pseudomonas putida TaxID=303 RepID=A0A9X8EHA2_PSEPU|nr:hypothetical protein EDF85_2423 [Pseudomonas putida]